MENEIKIKCRGIAIFNNKLLVVKHRKSASFYALPGGHLEWPENPKQCLEREIFEELGIKPKVGKLKYTNSFLSENKTLYIEFFFEITNSQDYLEIAKFSGTHETELIDIQWVGKNEKIEILPKKIYEDFNNDSLFQSQEVQFVN